jgi:hypothetical protein
MNPTELADPRKEVVHHIFETLVAINF